MRSFAFLVFCTIALAQTTKNYKDRAEYDLYNQAITDFSANNFAKTLMDLERWSEKYPSSDFKDERQMLYVQVYANTDQPAKAIDAGTSLLASSGPPSNHSSNFLRALYYIVSALPRVPDPSPQQLLTVTQAARSLESYDSLPQGMSAAAWETTRADLRAAARGTLLYVALRPVSQATKANDCSGAETAALKVLQEFPESGQGAWFLATAEVCLSKSDPEKASTALYEFARAATLDPAKAMIDKKWQQTSVAPYLEKAYTQFHGVDAQGLKELKQLAILSPLPPTGFVIKSATEIAAEQEQEFENKNPEAALWFKIRSALASPDGQHYFESELQGSAVPLLKGNLVEAKPECRPSELHVAIPGANADSQSTAAEIILKLDKPLSGKPELTEVQWSGIPTEFSTRPFLLTMKVDRANVEKLIVRPCPPNQPKKR